MNRKVRRKGRTQEQIAEAKRRRREEKARLAAELRQSLVERLTDDKPGRARPTPERIAHGAFALHDTDDAGARVAVDRATTMLDRLALAGQITREQCDGGHDFAALMERTRMVGAGRSCLDFSPVGHDGDTEDPQDAIDNRDRAELYIACGQATWRLLRAVCVEQHRPTDIHDLRFGLNLCVAFWTGGKRALQAAKNTVLSR